MMANPYGEWSPVPHYPSGTTEQPGYETGHTVQPIEAPTPAPETETPSSLLTDSQLELDYCESNVALAERGGDHYTKALCRAVRHLIKAVRGV